MSNSNLPLFFVTSKTAKVLEQCRYPEGDLDRYKVLEAMEKHRGYTADGRYIDGTDVYNQLKEILTWYDEFRRAFRTRIRD